MTAQLAPVNPAAGAAPNGIAFIAGKITAKHSFSSQNGRRWEVVIRMPAPDSYATPASVTVVCESDPGSVGDEVRWKCQIGGRRYEGKRTDRETGEVTKYPSAIISLARVE